MGFLNPLWLIGAASASIPLVIHLIGRRRESRVDFSSLKLLREVDRRRNLWLRVKRILLLVVRMAICTGVFLVLGRPVVNLNYRVFAHAPTKACLVIDDSPSMEADRGKLFLVVKEQALEIVERFDEKDEISVLTTSGNIELAPCNNRSVIQNFIKDLSTSRRIADFKTALEKAKLLLGSSKKINNVVYLISDLQATNFAGLEKIDLEKIVIIDVSKEIQNVSVTDVLSDELFSPKGTSRLRITLTNHSSLQLEQHVGTWLDGEKLQVTEVTLSPGSDVTIDLDISVTTPGYHSGYVKLMEDDDFLFDNVKYFTVEVPTEISVLIISEDVSEGVYLEKALRPKPELFTPFSVELISPRKMLTRDVLSYEVIALNNLRDLEFGQLKILQKYFETGGKACIFLGDRIDVDFYNMTLLSEFQTHANPLVRIVRPSFVSISRIELTHPVFSLFGEKRFGDLSLSKFYSYSPLETLPGQTLGWFGNGSPAVVEAPERGIIFGFSLGDSDITKRAVFVPLIHRLFYYLARKQEVPKGVLIGEKFKMGTHELCRNTTCITPEGEHIRIIPKPVGGETVITFSDTDEPGIYTVETDGKFLALFPVNIDPVESRSTKLSTEELNRIFSSRYELSTTGDVIAEMGLHSYELTKFILWIVLGLVFLEILLVQRR